MRPSSISTSTSRTIPVRGLRISRVKSLQLLTRPGRTRFDRLLLIGKCSVPLSVDALKTAVIEAKNGTDSYRYKEAWDCIRIAAPGEPEAARDDAWIAKIESANRHETMHLEGLLKGYKNNLIKESIRVRISSQLSHWALLLTCIRWAMSSSASTSKALAV